MVAKYKKVLRQLETMKRFQEITKAIRFITGGELSKIRKEINRRFTAVTSFIPLFAQKYTTFYMNVDNRVRADVDFEVSDYNTDYDSNGILVIPFCDDRGNCGSHNTSVLSRSFEVIKELKSNGFKVNLYAVGLKAKHFCEDFFRRDIVGSLIELGDVRMKLDICFFYTQHLMSYNFTSFYFIFNRFFSMEEQFTIIYRLCNFVDFLNSIIRNSFTKRGIFFETIANRSIYSGFMEDLYVFGFSIFLLEAFSENKYSFLGARYSAMDEMVNNSQDIIEKLTLTYNKLRQENITTEMIEIISAKNAVMSD